jgi:hypothetical protein
MCIYESILNFGAPSDAEQLFSLVDKQQFGKKTVSKFYVAATFSSSRKGF